MKKALSSLFGAAVLGICASNVQASLILHDPFDYPAGDLAGNGGWTDFNTQAPDVIQVTSGSLTAPSGLAASTGNKVTFAGGGSDSVVSFASQNSGTLYYSFLLNITANTATTGTYFGGLSSTADNTGTTSGLLYRRDSVDTTKFNLGIIPKTTNPANPAAAFSSIQLSLNTTYLIVVSHSFLAGAANDLTSIWINPTSFGGSAPTADLTATNGNSDAASLSSFILFQADSATPAINFDELRIGTSWGDVTPAAVPEPATAALLLGGLAGALLWRRQRSILA